MAASQERRYITTATPMLAITKKTSRRAANSVRVSWPGPRMYLWSCRTGW